MITELMFILPVYSFIIIIWYVNIYILYSLFFNIILFLMPLVIHALSLQRLIDIIGNGKHLLNIWS